MSSERLIINKVLGSMYRKIVVDFFKIISHPSPEKTDENL